MKFRLKGWLYWGAIGVGALSFLWVMFWVAPYNIAARYPHPPGVRWLLHTYMKNAVRTWSLNERPPDYIDLNDPALIRLGAGHFEDGCAPCHGAPGRDTSPIVKHMRPAPPNLGDKLKEFDIREVYWLVRNGLKYTAMPAWSGEGRDDEPWAVAAFLKKAYTDLTPEEYVRMAYGTSAPDHPPEASDAVTFGGLTARLDKVMKNCARCHGADGLGRQGTAPKIAGQFKEHLEEALTSYARNQRQSGIMEPIAAALSEKEREKLAEHYASLPPFSQSIVGGDPSPSEEDQKLLELGRQLAERGTDNIPACDSCHGEYAMQSKEHIYPRVYGQGRHWIEVWLHQWKQRNYGRSLESMVMHVAADRLTDRQIRALSLYYARGEDKDMASESEETRNAHK